MAKLIKRAPKHVSWLITRLLASPGDEVSRFALADATEEAGRDGSLLRLAGRWEVVYSPRNRFWVFAWSVDGSSDGISICPFARTDLPRCVRCGRRAHLSFGPTWYWWCDDWDCIRSEGPAGKKLYAEAP